MGFTSIALTGKLRSGKDTVAARLIQQVSYTRVAFADPLREMALTVDPIIWSFSADGYTMDNVHLSEVVSDFGWEHAKDDHPEVRRVLQRMGQTVRDFDPDFWVNVAARKIETAERWNLPVVVTDCRYPNEAAMLRARGFKIVRVERPGDVPSDDASAHESETAMDGYPVDAVLRNAGSLADLRALADAMISA